MAVHIHPLNIPPRYYKPIGQVVVGWNLTEALIASIVWHIHKIRDPKRGRLFTYRPSASEKLNIFIVSAKNFTKDPGQQRQLQSLGSRAKALKSKRNMLAHGLWGRMPKQAVWKVFYHREADDAILLRRQELTVDQVKAMAADISALNRDLKAWMSRNGVPPP